MEDNLSRPETFTPGTGSRHAAARLTSSWSRTLALGAATALLYLALFSLADVPWAPLVAVIGAAVSTALISWLGRRAGRSVAEGVELVLSPEGLRYTGDASVRTMRWEDVRAAEVVPTIEPIGGGEPTAGFSILRPVGVGLVGVGTTTVTGGPLAARTYAQDPARYGQDPTSGESRTAIPLAQLDERWPDGRIGEWVAHHRPDIAERAAGLQRHGGAGARGA